jgi:hypothetical protein
MEENHKLGLYISYYLSRFNEVAYKNLGYGTMYETHNKIGQILSVPPNTVKNWRDEFDPLFGHRVGWYQRPMIPSRIRVAEALEELDEISIRSIVKDILSGRVQNESDEFEQLISIAGEPAPANEQRKFIPRTPTGKAAEEFFISSFESDQIPFKGVLIDCRDLGVGYDFRIEDEKGIIFIEVKGLSGDAGGVLFTSKEWQVANEKKDLYYLCVIKNTDSQPMLQFINNPAEKLNPNKNIHTVIQVSWSVSEKELNI